MRKFQGYTFQSVMEEYAIRVYSLLEHSLRWDANEKCEEVAIASISGSEKEGVQEVMKRYEKAGKDLVEEMLINGGFSKESSQNGIKRLKRIFNGGK